jgi:hypothetical protein
VKDDTATGLYYFDRFGNLELLYREEGISAMYPVPLAPRRVPPVLPRSLDPTLGDEAELVLTDVARSLRPLPEGRPIRRLRVYQVLPKTETHVANRPRIGYANAESARMLLGTVPVEDDGSAYFRVPARKPIYFQAVDGRGRAVQSMRSVTYLQPGERRGCVGCHEPLRATPTNERPLAMRRPPSVIAPGPDGTRPWSYPRLVQPVLDRHCVRCHGGSEERGQDPFAGTARRVLRTKGSCPLSSEPPVLTGEPSGTFTRSYEGLRPYVRWYEWGGNSIRPITTRPGEMGADASPLTRILDDATHAAAVDLAPEERRRIFIWLDGNAPFYGTYDEPSRLAQRNGRAVPPPEVQ